MYRYNLTGIMIGLSLALFIGASTATFAQETALWNEVQKDGRLRCGAAEDPPYIIRDTATGDYGGLFVELCREFAAVLKVKPEFVATSWDNMVAGLQAKKWDIAMSLTATPQRALAVSFSKPVTHTEVTFLYNKQNPKLSDPKSVADIDQTGINIAVTSGSANDKYLTDAIKNASIMRLPGTDDIRMAVMSKRADIALDTLPANDLFLALHPDWATVLRPVPAVNSKPVAFALRRGTSFADMQVLDIFIADQLATGHIEKLFRDAITLTAKQ
ncbi:MAG: substrate-binding periplasmic protein [Brucella sp.]